MADIRCPLCGKPNPKDAEECQFCGARIKPILASTPADSKPIKAGEEPIIRDTSEFEKVKRPDEGPIRPGEAPTPKDTGELERALPSWLQSLRKGEEPSADEPSAEPFPDLGLPSASEAGSTADESAGELSDWLSGLNQAAHEDDEEVPDWLSGLRGGDQTVVPTEADDAPEANIPSDDADWMKALGNELRAGTSEPDALPAAPEPQPASNEEFPDWLQGLKDDSAKDEKPFGQTDNDSFPSWISGETGAQEPAPEQVELPASPSSDDLPDWLDKIEQTDNGAATPAAVEPTPDWLTGGESQPSANAFAAEPEPSAGEETPDWLNQFSEKTIEPEPEPASGSEPTPDWLASFGTEPGTPESAPGESVPDWLSNLEQKPGTGALSNVFSGEPVDKDAAPSETPDWLSQLQADVDAAQKKENAPEAFEVAPPEKKEPEPMPDWLSGIESAPPASDAAPALILEDENNVTGQQGETAFTMETPDWLSELKPEEGREKAGGAEEDVKPESLEAAALPSWVQAMRPVEAVVSAEPSSPPQEVSGGQVEQSGPLAGLQGVLPAAPGLGPLRKPPAYSIKLQVTENQQKYAAYLERLVTQETQAKGLGGGRLVSSRFWRWLISGLLFLAVLIPLLTGIPSAPASNVQPPEMLDAFYRVGNLAPNSAVLVIFDYDPALFGEMEAAAAPLMDHLLLQGPRLAFVSTSPTGPALAERFMLETQSEHHYQAGEQYVDLGYLAGGPTGVLGFATSPLSAVGTVDDWQSAPLQGVEKLSDFALIVILTDNADTGRVWIEQARSAIDNGTPDNYSDDTPILMAISAQAEPMLLPYYDSGQVQGIVTGLVGGKTYEQIRNRPALANEYWNAFGAGTFAAELLIVVGAVWGAVTGWRARKNKTGEEA